MLHKIYRGCRDNPRQMVVFLHGYGAPGDDLIGLADSFSQLLPQAQFVALSAPERCEINAFGRQWFGLQDFSPFNIRAGIDRAGPVLCQALHSLLEESGLTPQDLALVGFSQGTMMALEMMFFMPGLRGIVGFSGAFYPPIAKVITPPSPQVLLVHGTLDFVIPYPAFLEMDRQLKLFQVTAQLKTCDGLDHSINQEALAEACLFLSSLFTKSQVNPDKNASS